jgi:hypothetical protein
MPDPITCLNQKSQGAKTKIKKFYKDPRDPYLFGMGDIIDAKDEELSLNYANRVSIKKTTSSKECNLIKNKNKTKEDLTKIDLSGLRDKSASLLERNNLGISSGALIPISQRIHKAQSMEGHRKAMNKKKKDSRDLKDKNLKVERKHHREIKNNYDDPFSVDTVLEPVVELPVKVNKDKRTVRSQRYAMNRQSDKIEATHIRSSRNRRKAHKKKKKKERQQARKDEGTICTQAAPGEVIEHANYILNKLDWIGLSARLASPVLSAVEAVLDIKERSESTIKIIDKNLEAVDPFLTIAIFIYQSAKTSMTYLDHYCAAYMFCSKMLEGCDKRFISSHAISAASTLLVHTPVIKKNERRRRYRSNIHTQSFTDKIVQFEDIFDFVLTSSFIEILRDLFFSCMSLKLFNKDVTVFLKSHLGKPPNLSTLDTIVLLKNSIKTLAQVGDLINEGVPFSEAFFSADPYSGLIDEASKISKDLPLVTSGFPEDGRISRTDYANRLTKNIEGLKFYSTKIAKSSRRGVVLQDHLRNLTNIKSGIMMRMKSENRMAPIGMIVHGAPGVGKSKVMNLVYKTHSNSRGEKFHPSLVYHRIKSSDYWDGIDPTTQKYVHYSEVGAQNANYIKQVDPVLTEILSLCDSAPYPVDMSKTEDKGVFFLAPSLVMLDTNNKTLNADVLQNVPSSVYRRFYFLETTVKVQYRKSSSTELDPSLVTDCDMYDVWNFRLTREVVVPVTANNRKGTRTHVLYGGGYKGLVVVLDRIFREYTALESKNLQREMEALDGLADLLNDDHSDMSEPESEEFDEDVEDHKSDCEDPLAFLDDSEEVRFVAQQLPFTQSLSGVKNKLYQASNVIKINFKNVLSDLVKIFWYVSQIAVITLLINSSLFLNNTRKVSLFLSVLMLVAMIMLNSEYVQYTLVLCIILNATMGDVLYTHLLKRTLISSRRYRWNQLKVFMCFSTHNMFVLEDHWKFLVISSLSVFTIAPMIYKFFKNNRIVSQATDFKIRHFKNEDLNDIEEKTDCDKSYERIPVKGTKIWNSRNVNYFPKHTSSPQALANKISKNIRQAILIFPDETNAVTMITGIKGSYAIINTHALRQHRSFSVKYSILGDIPSETSYMESVVGEKDLMVLDNDVSIVRLSGVAFKNIMSHIVSDHVDLALASGFLAETPIKMSLISSRTLKMQDKHVGIVCSDAWISYQFEDHKEGMCGLPVLVTVNRGTMICGVHCAGDNTNHTAYATQLNKVAIVEALHNMQCDDSFMDISSFPDIKTECETPIPKSLFRYEDLNALWYFGKIKGKPVMINKKSKLRKSDYHAKISEIFFDHMSYIPDILFAPPCMRPYVNKNGEYISPYNVAMRKIGKQKRALDRNILRKIIKILVKRIVGGLHENGVYEIKPWDIETSINGAECDEFSRRMNMSTSGGFGFAGPKINHFEVVVDKPNRLEYEPKGLIKEQLHELYEQCLEDEIPEYIKSMHLKDEPKEVAKVKLGKTRVFNGDSATAVILQRQYIGPFYSLMVEFGHLFCTAIGINMHTAGEKLADELLGFATNDLFLEGDYSNYDQSMPFDIGWAVVSVIYFVMKEMKYNKKALQILKSTLSGMLFPMCRILEDLFVAPGYQPTGIPGTAETNSLRGLVLLMYFWYSHPELRDLDFFEYVLPKTYGDDVIAAVREPANKYFNNFTYCDFVTNVYGMGFTPASKDAKLEEFVPFDSLSFLKRNFVYKGDIEMYVCPLAMSSIFKSLFWVIPSSQTSIESQHISMLVSALIELYFHTDEELYFKFRQSFVKLINETYEDCHFNENIFPTYRYMSTYVITGKVPIEICVREEEHKEGEYSENQIYTESGNNKYPSFPPTLNALVKKSVVQSLGLGCPLSLKIRPAQLALQDERDHLIQLLGEEEKEFSEMIDPFPGLDRRDVVKLDVYSVDRNIRRACELYHFKKAYIASIKSTIKTLDRTLARRNLSITTQSGELSDIPISNVESVEGNLTDIMGDVADEKYEMSKNSSQGQAEILSLKDFLSRPNLVNTLSFPIGGNVDYQVDIWDSILNQPTIRSKLRNYALLRCNLKVKIVSSGMPFHYAKILASYQPQASFNDNLNFYDTTSLVYTGSPTEVKFQFLTYLSQSKYKGVIDVKSNKPLVLSCPYIAPQPMMKLYNNNPLIIPDTASYNDATTMGRLYVKNINILGSTSGTPTDVSIFVYAWLEDVEIGPPTGTVLTIATEADERKTGPIEHYGSRLARVFGMAANIPAIAPFATASASVASSVAGLASLFGWSYPVMNTAPMRIRNQPFQNGSQTIGYDTGKRITLDPKQEITIDGRSVGSVEDEMTLSYICGVESLFDTFSWETTDPAFSSTIRDYLVNPKMTPFSPFFAGFESLVQPTALSFAATPFEYWRGDITYRFEIVCSDYHRGKIAFTYEPNVAQASVINTTLDTNKQWITVIDIQESRDFEFTIQWASSRAWMRVIPTTALVAPVGEIGFAGTQYWDYSNGYFSVTPFTQLQSPDGSGLHINVYVRSDDMHFNKVTSRNLPVSLPTTESKDITSEEVDSMILNPSSASIMRIGEEHFGEVPLSFRSLLKRFERTSVRAVAGEASTGRKIAQFTLSTIPAVSPSYTSTALQGNLFSYLRYAYIALRGGIRHRANLFGDLNTNPNMHTKVTLNDPSLLVTSSSTWLLATGEPLCNMNGTVTYVPHTNGGIEFETPWYTNNLWGISFNSDFVPSGHSMMDPLMVRSFTLEHEGFGNTGGVKYMDETATGEDFCFMGFQGGNPYLLIT